jgi:hypothetical protein
MGPAVADMLQTATIAVVAEVPIPTLAHAVAPFPTRSELWLKFIDAYENARGTSAHAERPLIGAARRPSSGRRLCRPGAAIDRRSDATTHRADRQHPSSR